MMMIFFYLQITVGTLPTTIRQIMLLEPSEVFPVVELSTLSYSGKTILKLPSQSVLQQLVQFGKYTNYVFSQCFISIIF